MILAGPSAKESDPYNRVWIRDNALVALALIQAGEKEFATEITSGLLDLLEAYRPKIEKIIAEGKPYATERNASLLHPVYKESGDELDVEWGWRQNDAIGNLLLVAGSLELVGDHQELIQDLVKYLEIVEYWKKDNGIWEWEQQVQKNTIYSCMVGLRAVADYVEVPEDLIQTGEEAVKKIKGHSDKKYYDLAHLNPFLMGEIMDPRVIEEIEHELLRDNGVIRYHNDHYMSGGKHREAQWVLGLLMLGNAWLVCENREKAQAYLDRVDQLRVNENIPEAYIYKKGQYVPNEHTPLAWCHALALSLRRQLENNN
jgi:GH15 family glucan-1,4-alpha-glucosidase